MALESPECGSELNNFTVLLANRVGKWMPVLTLHIVIHTHVYTTSGSKNCSI